MICHDPDGLHGEGFYGTRDVCWVTAARANVDRQYRKRHEKATPDAAGYLPTDGVMIWAALTEVNPDDDFLGVNATLPGQGPVDEDLGGEDPTPPAPAP